MEISNNYSNMLKILFSFIFIFKMHLSAVPLPAVNNYESDTEGSHELERTGLNRREQPLSRISSCIYY